jgi:hypothetical protein
MPWLLAVLACGWFDPPPPPRAPEVDIAAAVRQACDDGAATHFEAAGAHVVVLRPTAGALVVVDPGAPDMAASLADAADPVGIAFNAQFQTLASNFADTRGYTVRGNDVLEHVEPGDPAHAAPDDFATLSLVGSTLSVSRGHPSLEPVDGRVFALGGLFPLAMDGALTESWFVDGQESGPRFLAQGKGKMLLGLSPSGCVTVVAQRGVALEGASTNARQAAADAKGLLGFADWRARLLHAGLDDVLALDSGPSAHLEVHGLGQTGTVVQMAETSRPMLRYGVALRW